MLQKTRGVVLRSIKYGDTSLITTIFTELYGVQSYMVQGIRSAKSKQQRAGLLQPASLLDLVVYHKPQSSLQRIKEFQLAHIYITIQEEIVKNSIALFSVEVLLRLLPEHAPMPEAFDFIYGLFRKLDEWKTQEVANFPVYFVIQISHLLGYEINGAYTESTPYLNLQEGAFTNSASHMVPFLNDEDAKALSEMLRVKETEELKNINLDSETRFRLLDWYLEFLHSHTQHMGNIRSLPVLRTILH